MTPHAAQLPSGPFCLGKVMMRLLVGFFLPFSNNFPVRHTQATPTHYKLFAQRRARHEIHLTLKWNLITLENCHGAALRFLFFITEIQSGRHRGIFLFSKHGVRLIIAQSGKVVQLETACAQRERFHYNTVYYHNAVFQIQLRDLKLFVFLMHSTNVHSQPRAGENEHHRCAKTQTDCTNPQRRSADDLQATSHKNITVYSFCRSWLFGAVLITYSFTVTSRSPPCRIVKLNPRFAEVQQNSTSSQFLLLCRAPFISFVSEL